MAEPSRGRCAKHLHDYHDGRNALLRPIHNRMPVIYEMKRATGLVTQTMVLAAVVPPRPSEYMEVDVSTIVNSAKYDGPKYIQPVVGQPVN